MQGHRVLGNVRAVDRENVAFLEAAAREAGGHLADRPGEIGVGEGAPGRPIDQGGLVSEAVRPGKHEGR